MRRAPQKLQYRQRGVALFIAMVALVVLLLASVALIRSTDTALLIAGNIASKRDLTNEGEQAIAAALAQFTTVGAVLATPANRNSNQGGVNYSAVMLPSTPQGIPNVLYDAAAFSSIYTGTVTSAAGSGVSYLYVIDRMCSKSGPPQPRYCMVGLGGGDRSQTDFLPRLETNLSGVVYRITVRVTDPKSTQSFLQTTFSI
jgi:Tfp pilus assembly protein PilX